MGARVSQRRVFLLGLGEWAPHLGGLLAEAETMEREVLAMRQKLLGAEHLDVALSFNNLANVLQAEDKLAEAESLQRQALVLVEWLGFSAEEAGHILRIAPSSVRGRLHRARGSLRETFGGIDA